MTTTTQPTITCPHWCDGGHCTLDHSWFLECVHGIYERGSTLQPWVTFDPRQDSEPRLVLNLNDSDTDREIFLTIEEAWKLSCQIATAVECVKQSVVVEMSDRD